MKHFLRKYNYALQADRDELIYSTREILGAFALGILVGVLISWI